MADVALKLTGSGKWDLLVSGGNIVRTGQQPPTDAGTADLAIQPGDPALLRLLLQGPWIADNGERSGPSLNDVRFVDAQTRALVQSIVETRSKPLIPKYYTSVTLTDVITAEDRVYALISVVRPGAKGPETVQVQMPR